MPVEEISLVSSQKDLNSHSHTHSQLVFQDDNLRFNCGAQPARHGDPNKTTRELAAIIDEKLFSTNSSAAAVDTVSSFGHTTHHHLHQQQGQTQPSPQEFRRNVYRSDESDSEEDDDVDDDAMNGGGGYDLENSNRNGHNSYRNNNNGASTSSCNANNTSTGAAASTNRANLDKLGNVNGKPKHFPCFSDGDERWGWLHGKVGNNSDAGVTIADPDGEISFSQLLHGTTEACGGSGRKEGSSFLSESGETLRAILSDPVTGALMDDAMILPCGHSFGTGGIHQVIRLDKGSFGDLTMMDPPRSRGVQFPFAVTDRVVIKRDTQGNKRTPQRFVGREAVVSTQCLNGWYVVKTLDNAESVKLQYRSVAKVSNDLLSSKAPPIKTTTPRWLQSS